MAGGGTGLGRWPVRLLALGGVVLLVLGSTGWWLSTRVLDTEGFADVAAKASQREEVRDYIADQATLRLARTSNFVSAARPVVADAISAAINTPPVKAAIHEFVARAHDQVFQAAGARRVDVDSQQAAVTVRSALQTINPALAKKLPANVLDATTTISQSGTVDTLFHASRWINDLYAPCFLLGLALLVITMVKARDRVHAIRVVGVSTAVGGALLTGVGLSSPALASVASTNDPGRGEAVATFIEVLVGRLSGAGLAFILLGILLALAPGHDGGDLRDRVVRIRAWIADKRTRPRWRFAGGIALMILAACALTIPSGVFRLLLYTVAVIVLYVGIVVCLRAGGLLVTDHTIKPLHKRQVFGVFACMGLATVLTGSVAVSVLAASTDEARANPSNQGCNGYIELCPQPLNQVVWPASHNAMSSSAYNFFSAEHTITIPEQLNAGARFLMLDAYYGYDDNGLVRTNLAGGVDRKKLEAEQGEEAVHELDRLGALTGVADTSGKKQDLYFCHDFCELGAVPAIQIFEDIDNFLSRNLTDVVIIDVEDYVQPKDLKRALLEAGLFDRVWTPPKHGDQWPSLIDMIQPRNKKAPEKYKRLIVMSEKHPDVYPWLIGTYKVSQETPFTFQAISQFNCKPNRGGTDKPFFIVNHWLRPDGPPDPVEASHVNSTKTLTQRLQNCIAQRKQLPNAVAVDFTAIGDMYDTVNTFNAAIAKQSGVTKAVNRTIEQIRDQNKITDAELRELRALHRLPRISEQEARKLLGPLADSIPTPKDLPKIANPEPEPTTTTTITPATTEPAPGP